MVGNPTLNKHENVGSADSNEISAYGYNSLSILSKQPVLI
jgi:hypothetical protein